MYQEGNPVNDIDKDGKVDSEEISVAVNGNLGKKLQIVQNDIEYEKNQQIMLRGRKPPRQPPRQPRIGNMPIEDNVSVAQMAPRQGPSMEQPINRGRVSKPVNPLLMRKPLPMSSMASIPEVSIYKQSNQVALVTRGLTGHIEAVNLFNRGYPY